MKDHRNQIHYLSLEEMAIFEAYCIRNGHHEFTKFTLFRTASGVLWCYHARSRKWGRSDGEKILRCAFVKIFDFAGVMCVLTSRRGVMFCSMEIPKYKPVKTYQGKFR